MDVVDNVFFLDLNILNKKQSNELKRFAKIEELDLKDIIKIIYNEAKRIGLNDKVKVNFKLIDKNEGSFKVIVESAYVKYNGTTIYPFDKIKSDDFEIQLDNVFGKVTLYNKMRELKKVNVTIDNVGLNLFSMTYEKAKEFLINISDRKTKNGYMEFPDSICFKEYGIKLNAKSDDNGNAFLNELVESIDIYNKDEFFNAYYFEEKKEEVKEEKKETESNIIVSKKEKKYDYEIPKYEVPPMPIIDFSEIDNSDIEIEIPESEKKEVKQEEKKEELVKEPETTEVKKDEDIQKKENELEELQKLLEDEEKQQKILEERIKAKIDELKLENGAKEEKEIIEKVEIKEPEGYKSYDIDYYKGIKEQGKDDLCVYFGQSKEEIRKYFNCMPKEIRDYEEMEIYDIFYAYYDENDNCTGIGIYNQEKFKDKVALYFLGENLITMKYKDIVKLIKKNDFNAIEDEDGIISLKYGISVDPKEESNYQETICDVIHIFKEGYYDEVYENF